MDRAGNVPMPILLVRTDIKDHHAFFLIQFTRRNLLDPQTPQNTKQLEKQVQGEKSE